MSLLHFGEHHSNALRTDIFELTEHIGSKAGILEFLRTFPDLREHILPGFTIPYEVLQSGNIPDLPGDFGGKQHALMYRSSHPDDHRGFIGELPTLSSRFALPDKTIKDLDHKTQELFKVYRALAYFQKHRREMYFANEREDSYEYYHGESAPPSNRGFLTEDDDGVIFETDEEIPLDRYHRLLGEVQSGRDTTDYQAGVNSLLGIGNSRHQSIIETIRTQVARGTGLTHDGLRGANMTGIYIQPEIIPDGTPLGGLFESPHKKGVYIITFRNPTLASEKQRKSPHAHYIHEFDDHPSTVMYDSSTGETVEIDGRSDGIYPNIRDIVELYKKVQAKNIFGEEYSFHMEFGFQGRKPLILQARQFSPYQKPDFSLEGDEEVPANQVIRGITDEMGIRVQFLMSRGGNNKNEMNGIVLTTPKRQLMHPQLRDKVFAGIPFGHRNNDDHGLTKLLYETGGVAVSGGITKDDYKSFRDTSGDFTGMLYSDGTHAKLENIEQVG